jgi:hypothetical protein
MSFSARWIDLTIRCIHTISYAIMVNGQLVGSIKPTRGIRQEDPLSPCLFLLCAEGLSSLLTLAEVKGMITGVPTSKSGSRLSAYFER